MHRPTRIQAEDQGQKSAPPAGLELIEIDLKEIVETRGGLRRVAQSYSDRELCDALSRLARRLDQSRPVVLPPYFKLLGKTLEKDPLGKRLLEHLQIWDQQLRGPLGPLNQEELLNLACALLWQTTLLEEFEVRHLTG